MKRFRSPVILALPLLLAGCMTPLDREPVTTPAKVANVEGVEWMARDGKFIFAGKASEDAIRRMVANDLTAIINLMTEQEVLALDYNEPALARELNIAYMPLPITIERFSAADVDRFESLLASQRYVTLVQSPTADRAGMLWGAYLVRKRGFNLVDAEIRARAAGMTSNEAAEAMRRVAMEGRQTP